MGRRGPEIKAWTLRVPRVIPKKTKVRNEFRCYTMYMHQYFPVIWGEWLRGDRFGYGQVIEQAYLDLEGVSNKGNKERHCVPHLLS